MQFRGKGDATKCFILQYYLQCSHNATYYKQKVQRSEDYAGPPGGLQGLDRGRELTDGAHRLKAKRKRTGEDNHILTHLRLHFMNECNAVLMIGTHNFMRLGRHVIFPAPCQFEAPTKNMIRSVIPPKKT